MLFIGSFTGGSVQFTGTMVLAGDLVSYGYPVVILPYILELLDVYKITAASWSNVKSIE